MINILLYVSSGLILFSFIAYFLLILISNKKITNSNGFDITKDIISEYNSINVIESKNYFTVYNIKRRVIRLNTKCYYGNSLSDITLSLIEAGISIIDDYKNKYINLFRQLVPNLKLLYIFPILSLFINHSTYNVSDARVSIIFIILFMIISYILYNIKYDACFCISDNMKKIKHISKDNRDKVIGFMNKILWLDKFIFFGEFIMVLRSILILLEINL